MSSYKDGLPDPLPPTASIPALLPTRRSHFLFQGLFLARKAETAIWSSALTIKPWLLIFREIRIRASSNNSNSTLDLRPRFDLPFFS